MRLLLLFFLLLFLSNPLNASDNKDEKRILLLYSYDPAFPTSSRVLEGFYSVFKRSDPSLKLDIEYMDTKRHYDAKSQEKFLSLISYKFEKRPKYDVIITIDDNALNFALAHRAALFPTTDVVFTGVNDLGKIDFLESIPWLTGVVEAASYIETLELMLSLQPERDNIHVITDNTTTSRAMWESFNELLVSEPNMHDINIEQVSLEDMSWPELGRKLSLLNKDDNILLFSAYKDTMGNDKSFEEGLSFIKENTKAPIYHLWEHGIGTGVVGGIVVSHREQGRQAALLAQRVLGGVDVDNIPLLRKSPNIPVFDYKLLKQFNIPMSRLPYDSDVVGAPTSLWETHKYLVLFISFVFLSLVSISVYLSKKNIQMKRLSDRLIEQTSILRLLMDTSPDLVWIKDTRGRYLTCNKRFEALFGAPEHEIIGKSDEDFVEPERARTYRENDQIVLRRKEKFVREEHLTFKSDGHQEILETVKVRVIEPDSASVIGVLGIGRDITERKKQEAYITQSEKKYRSLFEEIPQGVVVYDQHCVIIDVNSAAEFTLALTKEQLIGEAFFVSDWFDSIDSLNNTSMELIHNVLTQGIARKGIEVKGEFTDPDREIWLTIDVVPMLNEQDETFGVLVSFTDITQMKKTQAQMHHLAYHDVLSGLPNRLLLRERIEQTIKYAQRHNSSFTLMFLDLDNFKNINDSYGHAEGDILLKYIADYLKGVVREEDTVARLGGDEFVILFQDNMTTDDAIDLANKVLKVIKEPIILSSANANVTASLGICVYPGDGKTVDDLLRNADAAMYRAKKHGKNRFEFYAEQFTQEIINRLNIENDLRKAIENDELVLFYQPQIDLNSEHIVGVEGLVRWQHPERGMLFPDSFIGIAEESDLIVLLGNWVIAEAVKQAKSWLDQGLQVGRVAVNVSGLQFQQSDVLGEVKKALTSNNLSSEFLALEVTETFVMQLGDSAIQELRALKDFGIELAIDDFGTGYSSLSYLKKLPVDKLKIDRSFIQDIPTDKDDLVISKTIVALGESLNLKVIAEGVETQEQATYLKNIGCHEGQGYLYSKPVPAHEFAAFYHRFYHIGL